MCIWAAERYSQGRKTRECDVICSTWVLKSSGVCGKAKLVGQGKVSSNAVKVTQASSNCKCRTVQGILALNRLNQSWPGFDHPPRILLSLSSHHRLFLLTPDLALFDLCTQSGRFLKGKSTDSLGMRLACLSEPASARLPKHLAGAAASVQQGLTIPQSFSMPESLDLFKNRCTSIPSKGMPLNSSTLLNSCETRITGAADL